MSLRSVSSTFVRNLKPVNATRLGLATPCLRTYATEKKAAVHPPRRTFLHNKYSDIIENNRVVFIFQHNNLTVKEFTHIRQQLGELPGGSALPKLTVLKSGVFSAALRETKFANLEPLVSGPTCVLSTNVADAENPDLLKKSVELLAKNKKMLLLGGKLDNVLLTQADVLKVVELPPLDQLRAQVVGVIEAPARKLLGTLEQPANELHSVLDRRI
ncbi:50S ribosomal protein L10 [Mucor ambiguus]|uniref:50S ribosomal protein L10 n=1 Tax=Mucor ambiguus TaxID=91626 RepID=A0A0C9MXF3_9FUNG|nr:50S ribosomal protein L10 [Mucor ambiguus]